MVVHVQKRTTNHSLQVALTEYLIQIMIDAKCVDPGDD